MAKYEILEKIGCAFPMFNKKLGNNSKYFFSGERTADIRVDL